MGLPTAMTIASPDADFATQLAQSLHASNFRAYTSTDIVGVEVGGAVQNSARRGRRTVRWARASGANTRIALITRGLSEVMRLGVALGAQAETFMGLAGLGDLVLTSTDNQSRNRRFGLALASGKRRRGRVEGNRPGGRGLLPPRAPCSEDPRCEKGRHAHCQRASIASSTKTNPRKTW